MGGFTPAGQFEFMLKGQAGGKYLIQRSPDMRSWLTIGNTVLAPSNTIMFIDPSPTGSGPGRWLLERRLERRSGSTQIALQHFAKQ